MDGWAQRAVRRQADPQPDVYGLTRWTVLAIATLLALAIFAAGCTPRLVQTGGTYYVQWPGQMPDVVEIHGVRRDGWVQCRSVTDSVIWACNLNMALYFARVTATPTQAEPTGQRTD